MRKIILGFILGGIICSGIIYGATLYKSEDIQYSPTDSSWEVSNVNEAINNLYSMKQELYNIKNLGDAVSEDILKGKTAVVNGELITGTAADSQEQYDKGYADGLAKANNGTIVYEYHHHTSECEATCNSYYTRSLANNLGNNTYTAYVTNHHPSCGKGDETYYWTVSGNDFNGQSSAHKYYICGYEEGELIGAKMEFN